MVGEWAFVKEHPMMETPMRIKPEHFLRSLCEFREIPLNPATLLKSGFVSHVEDYYIFEITAGNGYTTIMLHDHLDGIWDINAVTADRFNEEKKFVSEFGVFLKVNRLQRIVKELDLNLEIEYEKDLD